MTEKGSMYNEYGQINDEKTAKAMADAENDYRGRTFGIFPPLKSKIKKGEEAAEKIETSQLFRNVNFEIKTGDGRTDYAEYLAIEGGFNGHKLNLRYFPDNKNYCKATLDGNNLSKEDVFEIIKKYEPFFKSQLDKIKENLAKEPEATKIAEKYKEDMKEEDMNFLAEHDF